jgi:hypothetical protein
LGRNNPIQQNPKEGYRMQDTKKALAKTEQQLANEGLLIPERLKSRKLEGILNVLDESDLDAIGR